MVLTDEQLIKNKDTEARILESVVSHFVPQQNETDAKAREMFAEAVFLLRTQRPQTLIYHNEGFLKILEAVFVILYRETHIQSFLHDLKEYDETTFIHSVDVFIIGTLFGVIYETNILDFSKACLLHDIGKTKIPLSITNKNGKLTEEEYNEMKQHPLYSYEMIQPFESDFVCQAVLSHHEKADGKGYPRGIKLEEKDFSFYFLIISVVDEFSALTLPRSYKKGFETEDSWRINCENLFLQLGKLSVAFRFPLEILTATHPNMKDYQNALVGENLLLFGSSLIDAYTNSSFNTHSIK